MVQEAFGGRKESWGVPGGLCDNNELLHNAAIRELKEETGKFTPIKRNYHFLV